MTTLRFLTGLLFSAVLTAISHADPPADLSGKYLTLDGNRLEFPDASSGSDGSESVTYAYSVTDATTAELNVFYPSSTRSREISLSFAPDGTPAGYQEFDFATTPPMFPPVSETGSFEIGDLDVPPPPPPAVESFAPEFLTGSFLNVGPDRYEFLTGDEGRLFVPGRASYFSYLYEIVDDASAKVTATFEDGVTTVEIILTFDSEGLPVSFASTTSETGVGVSEDSGEFEMGVNFHLGDLLIGVGDDDPAGEDYFNAVGSRQTVGKRLSSPEAVAYSIVLQNDGDTDSFQLRGTRGRRTCDIAYFTEGTRENITAAMVAGTYETAELSHKDEVGIVLEVTPKHRNGTMVAGVKANSLSVEDAKDFVKSVTQVKAAKKRQNRGRGRAHGRGRGRSGKRR